MNIATQRMILTLATGVLIGGGYIVGKQLLVQGFSPIAVSFVQVAGATLLLQTALHARGLRPPTDRRTLRFFAIAATIAVIGSTLLGNWVLARIPAGIFTLLVTLSPLFTSLLNAAVDRRLPTASALAGTLLGLAGVALVLVPRAQAVDAEQAVALAIAVAVPVLLAAGNVYRARHWPHGVPAPVVSAGTLGVQALMLLPLFAALHDGADLVRLGSVWPLLGLMVLITVAANVSAAYLQRVADSVAFSQIGYVIALTGLGLGALLFGERLGWLFLPALVLVFSGIVLVNRPVRAPAPDRADTQGLERIGASAR
ncbi:DMT family transporter [Luteimonas sp. SJ-92]|uniref:DMT family transporter n=1 Tax=Luteimonas salinisoli TaxID=2752307 RepID=A0A853J728_9GAMM|nr:DMT family transporter [Luteimonas salinisoli]NZA24851.1 DMT family transporter [Luteimonas salinisoli]